MTRDELFEKIGRAALSGEKLLVAIDGPAASGKTTLASSLAQRFDINVFHTDDYFLPPGRKTPERLAQPGGNVDYERLYSEIVLPLSSGKRVTYRPYSCSEGILLPALSPEIKSVNIIEGVYSLHPYFGNVFSLRLMLSVSENAQRQRILERSGKEKLEKYLSEWIPLENKYFEVIGNAEKYIDQNN